MNAVLQARQAGQIRFPAPPDPPEVATGVAGRLWRWTGDGNPLVTVQVATRETNVPDADGVRGHLAREIKQAKGHLDEVEVGDLEVSVTGADAAQAAYVDGTSGVAPVRHGLLVCTDGAEFMHVIHAVVLRITEGTDLVEEIFSAVSIEEEEVQA